MSSILNLESFYLFGAFQGIVLVILLLIKARSKANYVLITLIFLLSLYLLEQVIYLNGEISRYPHLLYTTLPITFLVGPIIYHYIRLTLTPKSLWKRVYIFHFMPFLYELIILLPFYVLSAESKISIYKYSLESMGLVYFDQFTLGYLIYLVSTTIFVILSFVILKNSRSKDKASSKKRNLLIKNSIAITIYLVLNIILFMTVFLNPQFVSDLQLISPLLLSLLIHSIGFICFLNPDVISSDDVVDKYSNSSLLPNQVKDLGISLVSLLEKNSLFLQHDLSPKEIAEELGVSTTNLSRVISEGLNTNFYSLINERRVKRAKSLIISQNYSGAKLIHIAFDSGFSNKTSFLRNFKRFTGMTPSEFRKKSTPLK